MDGQGCCGIDKDKFFLGIQYEIPTLYRDDKGSIAVPLMRHRSYGNDWQSDFDQFALLDLIEFFAENVRDVATCVYHGFYGHYHLTFRDSMDVCIQFRNEINSIFRKTGLLYFLNAELQVERVIENSVVTPAIESAVATVREKGARELLQEAIELHKRPRPEAIRNATEKIWDAFERLKTYYTSLRKSDSAAKIIADMSGGQPDYSDLFDTEFNALTKIGNTFRIRHHETDKVDIEDIRIYDYFFNRCMSLIAAAIQYLD